MGFPNRQASFVAGELMPQLWGRADLQRYTQGLRKLENFIVHPQGGISNRAGTAFVRAIKDNQPERLLPFEFSPELGQTYVLEHTPGTMRVHSQGQTVLDSGSAILEVATPWLTEASLDALRYAQSLDILTVCDGLVDAHEIKRLDHDSWTIDPFVLTRPDAPVLDTVTQPGAPLPAENQQNLQVYYCVTGVTADGEESLPSNVVGLLAWDFSGRPPVLLGWTPPAAPAFEVFNVYKANGGTDFFGFVGQSKTNTFMDRALAPVFNQGPPTGRDPFTGNPPQHVAYFAQRLWFSLIQTIHASRVSAFRNFDRALPTNDDDAIEAALDSLQLDKIRALVPMRQLLIFTASNVWGLESDPVTPVSLGGKVQENEACAVLTPIVSGSGILFYTGATTRELSQSASAGDAGGWGSSDLGITSRHLFQRRSIVAWAHQKDPDSIVWAVRDDGTLLSLTYEREHQVWAWARHVTDGFVEDVCCVKEGLETAVYLVVVRQVEGVGVRYLERMASRNIDPADPGTWCFLDSSLAYRGTNTDPSRTMRLQNSTWVSAAGVEVASPAYLFTVGDVGAVIRVGTEKVLVEQIQNVHLAYGILAGNVGPELQNVPTADWAILRRSLTGLTHLEGRTCGVLADGGGHPDVVVGGGGVLLQAHYENVVVGLSYVSEAETLDLEVVGQTSLAGKKKLVGKVTAKVVNTRGVSFGEGVPDDPKEPTPALEMYRGPFQEKATNVEVRPASTWNKHGRVRAVQAAPMPCTILSIEADTEVGG